jgi:hypothetical protein
VLVIGRCQPAARTGEAVGPGVQTGRRRRRRARPGDEWLRDLGLLCGSRAPGRGGWDVRSPAVARARRRAAAVVDESELRPAYRTLDDPVRFLGISLGGWVGLALAAALGYGWLLHSPVGFRASVSVAVVGLGAPACLLVLREPSTVGPGRLLAGVVRWRARSPQIEAPGAPVPVRRGGVRLDAAPPAIYDSLTAAPLWPERDVEGRGR